MHTRLPSTALIQFDELFAEIFALQHTHQCLGRAA
jgi:hypothetical protein